MKKTITLCLSLWLLTGCTSNETVKNGTEEVVKDNHAAVFNDIPQQLKEIDRAKMNTAIRHSSKSYLALLDSAFFADRDPESFQQTSHSLYRPGEKFEINPNTLSRGGKYEVRFLKFNNTENIFETIFEETVHRDDPLFTIQIPDEENVVYYIEQIALNKDHEVRKQEYHRLFVPYNELNARIELNKTTYSAGDTMTITLVELGTIPLGFRAGRTFEKWDGENWKLYKADKMESGQLISVQMDDFHYPEYTECRFEKGTYRIIEKLTEQDKISALFTVE